MSPVTVFSLGGTILSCAGSAEPVPLDRLHGPGMDGVQFKELSRIGSNALGFADILALAGKVIAAHGEKKQGFLVVQGTDTMEETAFLLDLLVPRDIAVVMTGAMRTADMAGADGPGNFADALTAVRALEGTGFGVCVCMGGEIHAAALVRKRDAGRPSAFASPGFGPLGYLAEGACRLPFRPSPRPGPYQVKGLAPLVGLIDINFAVTPAEIAAALTAPFAGLVVAGLGAGTMPPAVDPLLGAAADRIPVVITSRCGRGEVAAGTYVGPGTTNNLLQYGVMPGAFLDARKTRILLTVLLWAGYRGAALEDELAVWRTL